MRACDFHVIEMDYNDTFAERVSTYGGMDSELTGRMVTEKRTWRVVAANLDIAKAIWASTRGHVESWKVLEWRDLGTLDVLAVGLGF